MLNVTTVKGHYSTNCPKRPQVFAAQVIDEDAEPSSAPNRNHNDEADEEQGDQSPETEGEPIGSQYDLREWAIAAHGMYESHQV